MGIPGKLLVEIIANDANQSGGLAIVSEAVSKLRIEKKRATLLVPRLRLVCANSREMYQ